MSLLRRALTLTLLASAVGGPAAAAAPGPRLVVGQSALRGSRVAVGTVVHVDAPGTTARAKFMLDGHYLGADSTAPFSWRVAGPPGTHTLSVRLEGTGEVRTRLRATFSIGAPAPAATPGRARTVAVHDGAGLRAALAAATPGTTVTLADGRYTGRQQVTVTTACTASAPCALRGGPGAVLDGGGTGGHYGLHLLGARYWTLSGFTVQDASKGVVLDSSSHNVLDGLEVRRTGEEGIHLRAFSSDDVVRRSRVHHTGLRAPQYGEGIYVGSAVSNWGRYSGGRPDASDRDVITANRIWGTGAESVDVKEGTTGGTLSHNTFDGAGMVGQNSADSWVDVKGNGWQVTGNTGVVSGPSSLLDGFQTHVLAPGWGAGNVFSANRTSGQPGYGFRVDTRSGTANVVRCDNVSVDGLGLANVRCAPSG